MLQKTWHYNIRLHWHTGLFVLVPEQKYHLQFYSVWSKTKIGCYKFKGENIKSVETDIKAVVKLLVKIGVTNFLVQCICYIRHILQLGNGRLIGSSVITDTQVFTTAWCPVETGSRKQVGV